MRIYSKLAILFLLTLLFSVGSCQKAVQEKMVIEIVPQLTNNVSTEEKEKYYHPFNQLKQNTDCLKANFQTYPEGNQLGGIKTCLQENGDPNVYYIQFENNGNDPICFLPMTSYEDNTKEYIGDPVCIDQKRDQTFKVRLKKNRKGLNLKGEKFSEQKLNALFIVKDYRDALQQFHCCSNAGYYDEAGSGFPFPRCTYEYKINICTEFLLNYKGNYIHRLSY